MKHALPPSRITSRLVASVFPRAQRSKLLHATVLFWLASGLVYAQEATTQVEDTVVIKGKALSTTEKAKVKLENVTGNVSVVKNADVEKGRSSTLEDVLAFEPGVFAQATGGNDAIKISIRGSGIATAAGVFREGTSFLFDGLALTGSGGTPYELLEMSGIDYTEVLRGANAFQYGALALGGALNLATHTGRTSPGVYGRFEAGSFGWRKQQLSVGGVTESGDTDYYVSVTNSERRGYQKWTNVESKGIVGNFGFRLTPQLETRLYLRYREEYHQNPALLTLAQLKADSSQTTAATVTGRNDGTKPGSTYVGSKTTYTIDDVSKIEFGLAYHDYPQILNINSAATPNFWTWRDINASLRYLRSEQLFGLQSDTTVSFTRTQAINSSVKTYNGTTRALKKYATYDGSSDTVLAVGNELQLNPRTWLSSGLSLVNVRRDVRTLYGDIPVNNAATTYNHQDLAPRLGLRYELAPKVVAFANVSRSIDPPVTWGFTGSGTTATQIGVKNLTEQKANTVEIGLRGSNDTFSGSVALYRSEVRNELLTAQIPGGGPTDTEKRNATPTVHQGLEAGLDARLWKGKGGDNVVLRQAYTYNDFHYKKDPVYGANELPGLPKHVYTAELQYQHPSGFYVGVNARYSAKTWLDYANSLAAPSYTIFGAKVGYEQPGGKWSLFLDLRNLTDKAYASAISPQYNLRGLDNTGAVYVGDGFGAFAGASYRF
ncbi:MAG: TonB-dependent receptor [Burkholderiaceae bacterium]|uniref:TonB-dependent receptor family protein n=1 Tax=Herminiimonas sp. Marseille-P9896 TaxID=2742211 RepID=UPI00158BD3D5|nr:MULTISPECIES: TonB-dependent receptor [Oxalobacteraceae]MBX9799430.1 TonB-dependent receptor [Burkholderiaceae bacterium]